MMLLLSKKLERKLDTILKFVQMPIESGRMKKLSSLVPW